MAKEILMIRSRPVADRGRNLNMLRMFKEMGVPASVLCWDRARQRPQRETIDGAPIYNAHLPGAFSNRSLLLWVPLWWVFEMLYLVFHPSKYIHATDLDSAVPVLLWTKLMRIFGKRVTFVFDIADFYVAKAAALPKILHAPLTWLEQFLARHADAVVIPDEARLYLLGDTKPKRLFIVPNTTYDRVKPEWHRNTSKDLVIFYGGTLTPDRGVEKLVQITEGMENIRLVIAGRAVNEEQVAWFNRKPHVSFLGLIPQEEVLQRMYAADAVYSYYDPTLEINKTANSTKTFEAMMCGTAILCNAEPPSTRIVQEIGCGVCLPYSDDDALRQTILAWRDNRHIPREMGRRGRKAFEEQLSWPMTAAALAEFLREQFPFPKEASF